MGDDLENDVRGAIRAGLSAVLLDRGGRAPRDLPHVPDLTALFDLAARGSVKLAGRL